MSTRSVGLPALDTGIDLIIRGELTAQEYLDSDPLFGKYVYHNLQRLPMFDAYIIVNGLKMKQGTAGAIFSGSYVGDLMGAVAPTIGADNEKFFITATYITYTTASDFEFEIVIYKDTGTGNAD